MFKNINDCMSVKLTDTGLQILDDVIDEATKLTNTDCSKIFNEKLKDGVYTDQLWYIIQIFGAAFILGNEPPFTEMWSSDEDVNK